MRFLTVIVLCLYPWAYVVAQVDEEPPTEPGFDKWDFLNESEANIRCPGDANRVPGPKDYTEFPYPRHWARLRQ